MEIKLGQILYRVFQERNQKRQIREYKVTKIGRTYFYCNDRDDYPIDKETLTYKDKNYSQSNFTLYTTEQEILDMWERSRLLSEIESYFSTFYGKKKDGTLEQFREVCKILGI